MRLIVTFAFAVCFFGCAQAPPPAMPKAAAPPGAVSFKIVKWPDLEAAIAAHRGSIILIDLWAEY